jgi:hypothetical protein
MLPWFVIAISLFIGLQNVNLNARDSVLAYSGVEGQAPITFRIEALADAVIKSNLLSQQSTYVQDEPPQLWWLRLNYSGPQLRAIELYDLGWPGKFNASILHFVVPRILWPDKPELDNAGQAFNRQVTGNQTTLGRVGITVFGDGYWMAGWPGLVFFAVLTGIIFGLATQYSLNWLEKRSYAYLPAILLAFKLAAYDVLGFFESSMLGGGVIIIGVAALTSFFAHQFGGRP